MFTQLGESLGLEILWVNILTYICHWTVAIGACAMELIWSVFVADLRKRTEDPDEEIEDVRKWKRSFEIGSTVKVRPVLSSVDSCCEADVGDFLLQIYLQIRLTIVTIVNT